MTYPRLILMEPEIERLIAGAEKRCTQNPDVNVWDVYSDTKRELEKHVGWNAAKDALGTGEAYDVAIRELSRRIGV